MLQEEFNNYTYRDLNAYVVRINAKVAENGGHHFIDVCLMDDYLDSPDEFGHREPNVSYEDVKDTEYLQIVRVDKGGNILYRISNYLTEQEAEAFLIGYDVAADAYILHLGE